MAVLVFSPPWLLTAGKTQSVYVLETMFSASNAIVSPTKMNAFLIETAVGVNEMIISMTLTPVTTIEMIFPLTKTAVEMMEIIISATNTMMVSVKIIVSGAMKLLNLTLEQMRSSFYARTRRNE
jgi:hypothetical protein